MMVVVDCNASYLSDAQRLRTTYRSTCNNNKEEQKEGPIRHVPDNNNHHHSPIYDAVIVAMYTMCYDGSTSTSRLRLPVYIINVLAAV